MEDGAEEDMGMDVEKIGYATPLMLKRAKNVTTLVSRSSGGNNEKYNKNMETFRGNILKFADVVRKKKAGGVYVVVPGKENVFRDRLYGMAGGERRDRETPFGYKSAAVVLHRAFVDDGDYKRAMGYLDGHGKGFGNAVRKASKGGLLILEHRKDEVIAVISSKVGARVREGPTIKRAKRKRAVVDESGLAYPTGAALEMGAFIAWMDINHMLPSGASIGGVQSWAEKDEGVMAYAYRRGDDVFIGENHVKEAAKAIGRFRQLADSAGRNVGNGDGYADRKHLSVQGGDYPLIDVSMQTEGKKVGGITAAGMAERDLSLREHIYNSGGRWYVRSGADHRRAVEGALRGYKPRVAERVLTLDEIEETS